MGIEKPYQPLEDEMKKRFEELAPLESKTKGRGVYLVLQYGLKDNHAFCVDYRKISNDVPKIVDLGKDVNNAHLGQRLLDIEKINDYLPKWVKKTPKAFFKKEIAKEGDMDMSESGWVSSPYDDYLFDGSLSLAIKEGVISEKEAHNMNETWSTDADTTRKDRSDLEEMRLTVKLLFKVID